MSQPQETPLSSFYSFEKYTPERIFLKQPLSDQWRTWTYRQAGDEIRRIASAIGAFNLPPQSNIAILSKNCAHWIMADLAIMMAGHVSVPIYPTLSASGIKEILHHSEAKLIFLGKLDDYSAQSAAIGSALPRVSFPFYGPHDGLKWQELLDRYEPRTENFLPHEDQVASIMYSSGTTGTPKGVMLSFAAFGYVAGQVKKYLRINSPQRFFSYLPLSHIAERALMEMVALASGSTISFTESVEKFQQNLQHQQPTIFGGVPRIFAKFRDGILEKISQPRLDRLLLIPGVNILIRRMIIKKLGLANASVIVCGAAPTPVDLLEWFNKLGIDIRETYGMTENTAYSHSNFRLIRNGTVGQAWPGVDVSLDDNGEILVRHPGLMLGYYKDPVSTARVFTPEGFLRTGDQGSIDAQGFLTITGRIKDQFKTDKGKFVSPARIELRLSENTDLEHICVVGTGLPQPIALVTLSGKGLNKPKESVEEGFRNQLARLNIELEKHEQIRAGVILEDAWTVQNGLITPSMKIKRHAIEKRYSSRYGGWADIGEMVVWA